MKLARFTVVASLLAVSCGERENRVELQLGVDGRGASGFSCRELEPPNALLVDRISENNPDQPVASVVIDFIALGGVPGCRPSQLVAWCTDHDCDIVARTCIDIEVTTGTLPLEEAIDAAVQNLEGEVVTTDAPDGPVVVRATGVTRRCQDVPALGDGVLDVACAELFGCVYSCPVVLDDIDDPVVLDLDVLGNLCEQAVELCAASGGFEDPTCSR